MHPAGPDGKGGQGAVIIFRQEGQYDPQMHLPSEIGGFGRLWPVLAGSQQDVPQAVHSRRGLPCRHRREPEAGLRGFRHRRPAEGPGHLRALRQRLQAHTDRGLGPVASGRPGCLPGTFR